MTSVCPAGHDSAASDYCDVCGLAIPEAASTPPAAPEPAAPAEDPDAATCPNCQASNPPNALFCEACGYDFTTGTMPRPLDPPSLDLGALGLPDPGAPEAPEDGPDGAEESLGTSGAADVPQSAAPAATPPAAPPSSVAPPLAEDWVAEVWIDPDWYDAQDNADPLPSAGVPQVRRIASRSVLIGRESRSRGIHPDLDLGSDNGISRRHCQLTTDGTRWFVEDLGSSNGTYVGGSVGALPDRPIPPGEKREIASDERLYLGAWTRVVIRRAQPGEV